MPPTRVDIVKAPWEEHPSSPENKRDGPHGGSAAAAAAAATADGGEGGGGLGPGAFERDMSNASFSTDGQVGHDLAVMVEVALTVLSPRIHMHV